MQVQTLEQTLFNFLIWGNLDFLQKSSITSTTRSDPVKVILSTNLTLALRILSGQNNLKFKQKK